MAAKTSGNAVEEAIKCVTSCFDKIDKRQLATILFNKLLASSPVVKDRFQGSNMRLLATSFIGIMQMVIDDLAGMDIKACDARMKQLGGRHVAYGVGADMFTTYQACLLSALGEVMGDFNADMKYAWTFVWSVFVTSPLINGWAKTARLDRNKVLKQVTTDFADIQKCSDCVRKFQDTLFSRLFSYDPTIKDLFKDSDMEAQKKKFVGFIAKALEMAQKSDASGELRKLAAMHKRLGVTVTHFAYFEESILYALGQAMGKEYTGFAANAWTMVIHTEIVEAMVNAPFAEIKEMLASVNQTGTGVLTQKEWCAAFKDYGSKAELLAAYSACDADGNGTVEAEEFTRMLGRQQLSYPQASVSEHIAMFVKASQVKA